MHTHVHKKKHVDIGAGAATADGVHELPSNGPKLDTFGISVIEEAIKNVGGGAPNM